MGCFPVQTVPEQFSIERGSGEHLPVGCFFDMFQLVEGQVSLHLLLGRPLPCKNDRLDYLGILQKRWKLYKQDACGSLRVDTQAGQSYSFHHVSHKGF